MTASVIIPVTITDAMLSSTTVPETDFTAWNAATSYTVGTKVMRAVSGVHKNFQNLIAGVDATLPENATTGTTPRWLDLGATNPWAMFDSKVGTVTTVATSMTVVLRPGAISGLAFMELVGRTVTVTMKNAPGGTVVYSKTVTLDGTIIGSFFEWFFNDYVQKTDIILTDLPSQYTSPELTITISTTSGNVGCGVCTMGKVVNIGATEYGATLGITDYSAKTTDTYGNVIITKRAYSKRANYKLWTAKTDFTNIFRTLASIRSTPCVYIATEEDGYEPLVVYGFYKDFSIEVSYPDVHMSSLEVEGLI
jgi:hypothetical protein